MTDLETLLTQALALDPHLDEPSLRRAFQLARAAHIGQVRASGEPFLTHPCAVALTVAGLEQGTDAVAAALLHDAVEDGHTSLRHVEDQCGPTVAKLVKALTKMSSLEITSREAEQTEYFRRLLLSLGEDVRVISIKLADRLHNMQTLSSLPPERRKAIAAETLEVYAPLAHQLGMNWFRTQLEDLAFRELDPHSYQRIKALVAARRQERQALVDSLRASLSRALAQASIQARVEGRAKHFYGIYLKMILKNKTFDQIFDLVGLRIVTETLEDCYKSLDVAHGIWTPIPGRFKDYIACPKPNMYQSIHTSVRTDDGVVVELQIRTSLMDRIAEFGVAAHWRYHMAHQGVRYVLGEHFPWYERLVQAAPTAQEVLDALRERTEVLVLTPRHQLIPLRAGSTALDFAFALHTEIGLHCAGAKVNGKAVPLEYVLRTGDQVEILTSPTAHPTAEWLRKVTGPSARQKIRRFLRERERERLVAEGRARLSSMLRALKHPIPKTSAQWDELARSLQMGCAEDLFMAAARGGITKAQLISRGAGPKPAPARLRSVRLGGVRMGELRGIAVRFASCCRPLPGDAIVAMITRGRGASVHREDCPNAHAGDAARWLRVEWDVGPAERFVAHVSLAVLPGRETPSCLEAALEGVGSRLVSVARLGTCGELQCLDAEVEVRDAAHLDQVVRALGTTPGVAKARRGVGMEFAP